MSRIVDQGAIVAGWVGIGMAVTVALSFLLVIPIEPAYWLLALPSGLMIGYYANARADRRDGPWSRILLNALYVGLLTGIAYAVLLVGIKALFFAADDGYRDASAGGRIECSGGADCVYARYLDEGQGPALAAQGVTDVATFSTFYWQEQLRTAGLLIGLTTAGAIGGGLVYGVTRPKPRATESAATRAA
jgi:hypothetical protein